MATKTLEYISTKMKNIDLCMLNTKSTRGSLTSRPMSNNGDVTYDGSSYFFSLEDTQKVKDIENDSSVNLNFSTKDEMYICVTGKARIIRTKSMLADHWVPSLDQWFEDGVDTKGLIMIIVQAHVIRYWHKMDQGEIKV